jgi:hypothetical protein
VLSPLTALAFVGVQQGLFSLYLGCSFAPNHMGMPIIEGDKETSVARRQVITPCNVTGPFTTLMLSRDDAAKGTHSPDECGLAIGGCHCHFPGPAKRPSQGLDSIILHTTRRNDGYTPRN